MAEAAYTAKDITVLEGLEPVRLRPGMYIGSTGSRGLHHLVYEVVDNAVDEALAGRNDRVDVAIHPDNSMTVRDAGAGIPVDVIAEQGLPALTVVLTKLHAGKVRRGRLQGVRRPPRRRRLGRQCAVRMAHRRGPTRREGLPPGVRSRRADDRDADDRRRGQGGVGHDDLLPAGPGGLRRDGVFGLDALAAAARDRVSHARAADRPARRAGRGQDRGVPLRGRHPRLRLARQRCEGHRPQARRFLRGRLRRRPGRGGHAVEHLVRRVGLLLREQHQHDRGRRPSLGLPLRAHRLAEPLRARQGLPEGEGGEPRGRGRPRGPRSRHLGEAPQPAVRGPDEDEARQPADRGPRPHDRQPATRAVPRGEPDRGEADRDQGDLRLARAPRGAEGARAHATQERARLRLAARVASPTARSRTRSPPSCSSWRASPPAAPRSTRGIAATRRSSRCAARSSTPRRTGSTRFSRTRRSRRSSRRSGPASRTSSTSRSSATTGSSS